MKIRHNFIITGILFILFCALTVFVLKVDVQPIGPNNSEIGAATLNQMVHNNLGVHMILYNITDVLGYVAILTAFGFGVFGLIQIIKRRSLFKVDFDILSLGGFYVIVVFCYAFFEKFIVNYRPIIMDGELEASFPSSHTMLVVCIMGAAMIQFHKRLKNNLLRILVQIACAVIIVVTVAGRLLSGVHWFTDIIGGIILGAFLISLYYTVCKSHDKKENDQLYI